MAKAPVTADQQIFTLRSARSAPDLDPMLQELYGQHPDYAAFRTDLAEALAHGWAARPADLKLLDLQRDLEPDWFQRADMAGYVFYIDRFAGRAQGPAGKARLPHRAWHHLCPPDALPETPPGQFRWRLFGNGLPQDQPRLRQPRRFQSGFSRLRARGISLCIDLVLNHTAKEHRLGKKGRQGRPRGASHVLDVRQPPRNRKPIPKPWSRFSPTTPRAISPITPLVNGSGPPSTNISGI